MEKILNKKITILVGLLILIALLAGVAFGIVTQGGADVVEAATVADGNVASIGNHGIGKVDEQLAPGQEQKVRERHNADANTEVVWIYTYNDLKLNLNTSTAAASNVAAGKILIFANSIDWTQSSIASDVGTQKFSGILDGNGYKLNINFTAPVSNGGTSKGDNNAYYKVTTADEGITSSDFPANNGDGVRGMGLVVGVNAGTITNLTINYSAASGAMEPAQVVSGSIESNSLDSAQDPDCSYAYGIVTGVNIGTIRNVYVNQTSTFNGNTKKRVDSSGMNYQPNTPYTNFSAVGGVAGVNMGSGVVNKCYMYVGAPIWAQADGSADRGSWYGASFVSAFAGGLVGLIRGDNAQLTYCYLDGEGTVNAWGMRGDTKSLASQNYAWSLSYAGGITAGKIIFVVDDNVYYGSAQAMGANQVMGIISNWTGTRNDSYGKTYLDGVGTTGNFPAHSVQGMPFDLLYSADQGSDKQDLIVFTYNYKQLTGNSTLDMSHDYDRGSAAKLKSNWTEVYPWGHDLYDNDEVSVTFEGNNLRIQAKSGTFTTDNSAITPLEDVTKQNYNSGYRPKYNSSYQGSMIWGVDIYSINANYDPEVNVESKVFSPTDQIGSFVMYYDANMAKGSYVVKFGATYDYNLQRASKTSREYNGNPITDMMPTLSLTNAGGSITPNQNYFAWNISGAKAGAVSEDMTLYPDTYYIQPYAKIANPDAEEGEPQYTILQDYAYYDESQRTLAVNKGVSSTVVVTNATLSLTYDKSDQWVKEANVEVVLTANGENVTSQIISAYSYQGGTNNSIIDLGSITNNTFSIKESMSTPENGRTIYNVTAYVYDKAGNPIAVADTSGAIAAKKTARIKIDATAPILVSEQYFLASEFADYTSLSDAYNAYKAAPDSFNSLSNDEVLAGRWYNQQIVAFAILSDEDRSGVDLLITGVEEPLTAEKEIFSDGSQTVVVIRLASTSKIRIGSGDKNGNNAELLLNGGVAVNIDTTPITLNAGIIGANDDNIAVSYSYKSQYKKSFSKLGVQFNANFGGSGLYVWYYIDESGIGDDVVDPPEGAVWTKYEFDSAVSSGGTSLMLIPESMENAAVFVKFTSGVEGYDVAEPLVLRVVYGSYKTFSVDLNGADISIMAEYISVTDKTTGFSYPLGDLLNGMYDATINLSDFFAKTYDGTTMIDADKLEIGFNIDANTNLDIYTHYTGTFYDTSAQRDFKAGWLKLVAEYDSSNSGDTFLEIYIVTSAESPIDMRVSIDYGGEIGVQNVYSVATNIEKANMSFDINQIFAEGQNITMTSGSYSVSDEGLTTFNFVYGDPFDGLVATIYNDKSQGTFSFRFKSQGLGSEPYMNVGGNYTAYVDAIKIDSPVYQMDDFALLEKLGDKYVGDAGINYTVEISGTIAINIEQKEVRLTFALDGLTRYSFSIPYDMDTHIVTASYKDVDGQTQYADIVWKNSGGATLDITGIKDIGSYTAIAQITDGNYKIKANAQSQQTITIAATYLDVSVPDKVVQYNDGHTVTYIPDLPEGSVAAGKKIIFTITYYQKLGESLKVIDSGEVTEVGEYFVRVVFDPEVQEDPDLKVYARKEYTKQESASGGSDNYIAFTVTKADTSITKVESETKIYNSSLQLITYANAQVLSKQSKLVLKENGVDIKPTLQYWDEAAGAFVDFDPLSNNGKYKDVGQYRYRVVFNGNENYNGSYVEVLMTIDPATITGVIFGQTLTNGNTGIETVYKENQTVKLEADLSSSNVKDEADVSVGYRRIAVGNYVSDAPSFTDANTYQVWLQVTCGDNYLPYETSAYVIINRAPHPDDAITFEGGNQMVEYEYDGKEHSVKYTLNTGKYGTAIMAQETMTSATDAGEYVGSVNVILTNYESREYETVLKITPKKITTVDTSSVEELIASEGLTSHTDLTQISITFKGVNGRDVEADITFWDSEGNIVIPDNFGSLPAGKYTVTCSSAGGNYDLSEVSSFTLTLAEAEGERPHEHVDKNGDGYCDVCGTQMGSSQEPCDHVDEDNDGFCDLCGASLENVDQPNPAPNVALYVVLAICGVLVVISVVAIIIAAVVKSKKKKNDRYNII